jgi:putative DNA primase/helicase
VTKAPDVLAELRRSGLIRNTSENYRLPMRRNDRFDEAARAAWAFHVWREAWPAAGTIVESYLANRGLAFPPPQYLRFHPACPHPSGANLPAMIGLVEHVNHRPTAIHRTFISADGSSKAAVEPDKASLGPVAGGAVRLAQVRAGQWLLVAEGLETTLSVMHACALPAWAALSAGIKSLVLPPSANMVVICADNDANGVGHRAANAAAERFLAEGRRVRIALPPRSGLDFNDLLSGSASARFDENRHVA